MSISSWIFVLFFVATTFVSGQNYLVSTVYEDSQCSVLNGGRVIVNLGTHCSVSEEGCLLMESGLYQIQNCTDNPLTSPTDASFILYQETDNGTCNSGGLYNNALVGPLNVCIVSVTTYAFKLSGCTAQNSVIVTTYASLADCKKNIGNTGEQVLVSGKCKQGPYDAKGICPVSVPVASTPNVSATPTSAPQAATPVKKSSDAVYNVVINLSSIATLLVLVCA